MSALSNLSADFAAAAQQDDVTFWSERFRDHAMFLYLLLDNNVSDLKQAALQASQNWTEFLLNPAGNQNLQTLLTDLIALKQEVFKRASQGQQINLLLTPNDFLALVHHMINEFKFFVALLTIGVSPENEIAFWTHENAEHTELTGHLLPPGELQNQTLNLAQQLKEISQNVNIDRLAPTPPSQVRSTPLNTAEQVQTLLNMDVNQILSTVQTSNKMALDLDQTMSKIPAPTSSDKVVQLLLEHEIKEAQRGQRRLQELSGR